ncbi:MAG: hypothetical protein WCO98_02960 [bacterium]
MRLAIRTVRSAFPRAISMMSFPEIARIRPPPSREKSVKPPSTLNRSRSSPVIGSSQTIRPDSDAMTSSPSRASTRRGWSNFSTCQLG